MLFMQVNQVTPTDLTPSRFYSLTMSTQIEESDRRVGYIIMGLG